MKHYNVGIIGYGWAATAHIAAINATTQGRVTAVYSSRPLDSAELSAKHGGTIKAYQSLDAMLADPDLHVVDITSYPSQHRDQAVAAANAKKHVILEKPMANTPEEVREILAAAEANGVKGCICFECRYSNQFQVTKALIDEGLLGSLHYGEVDYYHGIGPWYGQYRWNIGKKEGGSALLTAGCLQPYYFHTHLVGSEGSLLDDKFHSAKLKADKAHWSKVSMKMLDSGDVSDHPYQAQFQAFFDALDAGRDMPLTSFKDAAKTFAVIFAADKSAAQGGQPVRPG
jgi:predicted dehydrogenase